MRKQIATLVVGMLLGGGLMATLPAGAGVKPAKPSLKQRVKTLENRTVNVRMNRFDCYREAKLVITDTSILCEVPENE